MNLRGIITVSGRPGLFKLIGKNKSGLLLESLDEKKIKITANMSTSKVSSLEDITVFAHDNTDLKLIDIFECMKDSKMIPDLKMATNEVVHAFFTEVAATYDSNRVYVSDIKKIVNWFNIIKELPLFTEKAPESPVDEAPPLITETSKKLESLSVEKPKPIKAAAKSNVRLSQKSK